MNTTESYNNHTHWWLNPLLFIIPLVLIFLMIKLIHMTYKKHLHHPGKNKESSSLNSNKNITENEYEKQYINDYIESSRYENDLEVIFRITKVMGCFNKFSNNSHELPFSNNLWKEVTKNKYENEEQYKSPITYRKISDTCLTISKYLLTSHDLIDTKSISKNHIDHVKIIIDDLTNLLKFIPPTWAKAEYETKYNQLKKWDDHQLALWYDKIIPIEKYIKTAEQEDKTETIQKIEQTPLKTIENQKTTSTIPSTEKLTIEEKVRKLLNQEGIAYQQFTLEQDANLTQALYPLFYTSHSKNANKENRIKEELIKKSLRDISNTQKLVQDLEMAGITEINGETTQNMMNTIIDQTTKYINEQTTPFTQEIMTELKTIKTYKNTL